MKRAGLLALTILPLVLWGCAFADHHTQLQKTGVSARKYEGKSRTIVVVVGPFADKRAITDRIGMKKNAWGIDTASVLCPEKPAAWIADRLVEELAASGYTILTGEAAALAPAGSLRIEGELVKLFVESVPRFFSFQVEADFHVRLLATLPGGGRAERNVFVKGTSPESFNVLGLTAFFPLPAAVSGLFLGASDHDHDVSLKDGAQRLTNEMVRSIGALADREPSLGASGAAADKPAGTERRLP